MFSSLAENVRPWLGTKAASDSVPENGKSIGLWAEPVAQVAVQS